MSMIKEFKEFAMRGNVVDMAIGIIIGAAFGRIVSSFVADIIMPPIGFLIGSVDFSELAITLQEATADTAAVTLNYGAFIQSVVDFLLVALAIFIVIKVMNSTRRKEEAQKEAAPSAPPAPSNEEALLAEIRDLLRQQQ